MERLVEILFEYLYEDCDLSYSNVKEFFRRRENDLGEVVLSMSIGSNDFYTRRFDSVDSVMTLYTHWLDRS